MDIKEYRYIYEIARTGSFSKAAAALHISQPSLSQYLKNVEQRIGVKLFETTTTKITITRAGEVYVKYAQQVMALDQALMDELDGMRRAKSGLVRIGITGSRSSYVVPYLMEMCEKEHPGIQLQISEGSTEQLEDQLLNKRELDMILANEPFHSDQITVMRLFREQVLVAVPTAMADTLIGSEVEGEEFPRIDLNDLRDMPFTLLQPQHRLRQFADSLFTDYGFYPKLLHQTQRAETAYAMTKAGQCACFIYDSLYKRHPDDRVKVFSVGKQPVYRWFAAAYRENSMDYPPFRAVLETVTEAVHQLTI